MSIDQDSVQVIIPTLNEVETIEEVITKFREEGFSNILVIDGHSTDGTRAEAEGAGADVVLQSKEGGKGAAMIEAIESHITSDYVIFIDGDETYLPSEAEKLLQPLQNDNADEVIGNRFANMKPNAMTRLNQFGNKIINLVFTILHRERPKDILTGYRAYETDALKDITLTETGFGIETELSTIFVSHDEYDTKTVPITYKSRPAGSEENLQPFSDGATILRTLFSKYF